MRFLTVNRQRRWQQRNFADFASLKHIRERGLDHAVEREKQLRPVLNVKNLIISDPAKSLPLPIIHNQKQNLEIPTRPIEFIRKYPAIFEEYLPGGTGIQPHIKLTPQVLDLDAEEKLVYQSENYRKDVADRLLKLLMISRINKVPLKFLDSIKWELGLHQDYVNSLLPDFPDCFRLIGGKNVSKSCNDLELELVCWSRESAISVVEKKMKGAGMVKEKGMPISFPMQFSKGFEMDKKLKKWYDDWQKLPYISPYENATHLGPSSDESEKWTVGVVHEILNLFVSRMVEKDALLSMGEWLGIRSRFKRALLHHHGIFYLSSKMGMYTVVLKEEYKRGLLINSNPVMNIRNRYLHLMHMVIEDHKGVNFPGGSKQQIKQKADESKEQAEEKDGDDNGEDNGMISDFKDGNRHDYGYDEEDEESKNNKQDYHKVPTSRVRADRKKSSNARASFSRNDGRRQSVEKLYAKKRDKVPSQSSGRIKSHRKKNIQSSSSERLNFPKSKRKLLTEKDDCVARI